MKNKGLQQKRKNRGHPYFFVASVYGFPEISVDVLNFWPRISDPKIKTH